METYGVPSALDLLLLRSYLRPNFLYDITAFAYVPKKVAWNKLNHLSDVPPLSANDYLGTDLAFILLVLLLSYATLSSPVRRSHAQRENILHYCIGLFALRRSLHRLAIANPVPT